MWDVPPHPLRHHRRHHGHHSGGSNMLPINGGAQGGSCSGSDLLSEEGIQ